jgi:hypothetical protein
MYKYAKSCIFMHDHTGLAPKYRTRLSRCGRDGTIPNFRDLSGGERSIRSPQSEREGERDFPRGELLISIEELDALQELPGPFFESLSDLLR